MNIRCTHCGKEFTNNAPGVDDGTATAVNELVNCPHCGGIQPLMDFTDLSLPTDYVRRQQAVKRSWLKAGIRHTLSSALAVRRFFSRHIGLQFACYILVLALSLAYLLNLNVTRAMRKIPIPGIGGQMSYLDDIALERCKAALAPRLNNPAKAKHPWNFRVTVEHVSDGTFKIRSYVDDFNLKGERDRLYYTCTLKKQGNEIVVSSLDTADDDR